jgi:ubiquinone/menaquinone biosynthesis C-methylase UbiE
MVRACSRQAKQHIATSPEGSFTVTNLDDDLYSLTRPDSLSTRLTCYQRRKMFQMFLTMTGVQAAETILDVGATSERALNHSNYLEAWYPHKNKVTATGIDDASFLEDMYPGIRFVRTDGHSLPFPNGSFDYMHSSAVLEHVGSRENQTRFLKEGWRVARKGIFVTTPNRWFPIEVHTALPLLHWLPAPWYRQILGKTKLRYFAFEENVNLLSPRDLKSIATRAGLDDPAVKGVSLAGWTSNLLLFARRRT